MFFLLVAIAGTIAAIYQAYVTYADTQPKKPRHKRLLLVFIVVAILSLIAFFVQRSQEREQQDMESKEGAYDPPLHDVQTIYPPIIFAGTLYENNGHTVTLNNETGLDATIVDGKLKVELKLYDDRGNLMAEIVNGEWQIHNPSLEANRDDRGFEIVAPGRRVLFQLDLVSDTLYCDGILFTGGLYVYSREPRIGGFNSGVAPTRHPEDIWLPQNFRVPRIFRYPMKMHFHEREPLSNEMRRRGYR